MKYGKIVGGKFIDRPNRFIAHVEIAGKAETVHVKNTGRCRELLLPVLLYALKTLSCFSGVWETRFIRYNFLARDFLGGIRLL